MLISSGEFLTWKGDGGDVTGATLHCAVYEASSSPVNWNQLTINWTFNSPFIDAAGNRFPGGGDQKWAYPISTSDVRSGVVSSAYNRAVYFEASTSEGTRYGNNGEKIYLDFQCHFRRAGALCLFVYARRIVVAGYFASQQKIIVATNVIRDAATC